VQDSVENVGRDSRKMIDPEQNSIEWDLEKQPQKIVAESRESKTAFQDDC
jgi:hypothetical protein